ncbi:MAG: isoprenylcysteine carboxylmethyltransferase family protein [Candidatus Melainabacteria bacterium]|jgi:protein-S-isoprenylcysteine O-methyltransferase Ste14|nr:isoprenylcysteine carboxylmethyltransferase family protein [Candidatus Melainabacteria bacterium]
MTFNLPTMTVLGLLAIGCALSFPVLYKGFSRRGKGVVYESNFLIQRAPQLLSGVNVALIVLSYGVFNGVITGVPLTTPLLSLTQAEPSGALLVISWLGVLEMLTGFVFMIGGWYSLGDAFSTDAELLEGQEVKDSGLLRFVMHPAYSGIIQSLVGASIAALSPLSLGFALFVVAPLWLRRAKYEEELLVKTFGEKYKDYAAKLKWRRLVPKFFPIGV